MVFPTVHAVPRPANVAGSCSPAGPYAVVEADCGHYRLTLAGAPVTDAHYTSIPAALAVADRLTAVAA